MLRDRLIAKATSLYLALGASLYGITLWVDPPPKPVKFPAVAAAEMATQVRVITTWGAPAQAVDSIVISTSFANAPLVVHQKPGTALADTALFPISLVPPGGAAGGQVDILTRRRGLSGPVVTKQFNFTRSDVPPPSVGAAVVTVDSI